MSRELFRLSNLIYDTPHLVTEEYLDKVSEYLELRNSGNELSAVTDLVRKNKREVSYFQDKALGVVDISGAISDIPHYALCEGEGVSHQSIREEVSALAEQGAKVIVLDMDTNGGIAHMSMESARYIRDVADEYGIKLISYVSSSSFSAGYVYSAVAHEVIANPSSEVGSIGVRVKLRNMNGALKNMGIEDVYITAGENKVPFNSKGEFTDEFLSEVKESVLDLYDQFTDHVAMYRGMTKENVIALGANSYSAKKGLSNGLVDKIMTLEEFKSYLEEITLGEEMNNPVTNLFKSKTKGTEMSKEDMTLLAELQTQVEQFQLENVSLSTKTTKLEADLAEALASLAAVEKEKAEAKQSQRVAVLSAVVGDEQAKAKAESLASLSDEAFDSVVDMLKGAKAASEQSELMTELGDEGEAVVTEEENLVATAQAKLLERRKNLSKKGAK